jgi:hypothetical protein
LVVVLPPPLNPEALGVSRSRYMAETIAKLDAAKRQLTVAIRLFFNHADPVAIHTLAAAAYQILYDLSKGHGMIGVVKGNPNVRTEIPI